MIHKLIEFGIYTIGAPFVIVLIALIHKLMLKKIWYRWTVNSLLYFRHKRQLDILYSQKTKEQAQEAWCNFTVSDHWSKGFWFEKKLSDYILNKYC